MSFLTSQYLLITLFCCALYLSVNAYNCRTTTGKPGRCKMLIKCEYTTQLRKKLGRHSARFDHFLSYNFCGFRENLPAICCPDINVRQVKHKPTKKLRPRTTTLAPRPKIASTRKPVIAEQPKVTTVDPESLLPSTCGVNYDIRIVGGETMKINEFPWMVLLEYHNTATGEMVNGCSGALISNRYVLTAGHCLRAVPSHWRLERVRIGEYNTQTEIDCEPEGDEGTKCADRVLLVPVESDIVHEDYWKPRDFANDIALLRLAHEVPTTTDYVQPICLPEGPELSDSYWASGWGKTEQRSQSQVKLKVNLPRFDFGECSNLYDKRKIVLDSRSQICAGGQRGKDTCAGDSGGPLMKALDNGKAWVVDGIVSMGHSTCGTEGWPAVYTKVYHYVPWILSKLQP